MEMAKESMAPRIAATTQMTPSRPSKTVIPRNSPRR